LLCIRLFSLCPSCLKNVPAAHRTFAKNAEGLTKIGQAFLEAKRSAE